MGAFSQAFFKSFFDFSLLTVIVVVTIFLLLSFLAGVGAVFFGFSLGRRSMMSPTAPPENYGALLPRFKRQKEEPMEGLVERDEITENAIDDWTSSGEQRIPTIVARER